MVAHWSLTNKLELNNGNIINGHDDNIESLTDNADGNDVGIE